MGMIVFSFIIMSMINVWETDLEHTIIVHLLQGESKALSQHSVKPALHDGRHAEPVQRELWGENNIVPWLNKNKEVELAYKANFNAFPSWNQQTCLYTRCSSNCIM